MAKPATTATETRTESEISFDTLFDAGIPVTKCLLHQAIMVPGLSSEKDLSAQKMGAIEMRWCPQGLLCKSKGKRFGVAQANVVNWMI